MKGSTPKQTTQTVKNEPWAAIQPDILNAVSGVNSTYSQPRSYYPNSTVVPFSGQTTDALSGIEARARAGSPVTAAMQAELGRTLGGDYLNSSPGNQLFRQIGSTDLSGDAEAARRVASGGDPAGAFRAATISGANSNPATAMLGEQAGRDPVASERLMAMLTAMTGVSDPSKGFYDRLQAGGLNNNAGGIFSDVARTGAGGDTGTDVFSRYKTDPLTGVASAARSIGDNGTVDPSTGFYRTQADGGLTNDQTGTLRDLASGGANPELDAMFDRIAGKIGGSVDRNAALAGRTGSATHQRLLQDGLTDAATEFYGQQYNNDQNRRLTAGGQLAELGEAGLNRREQGAQALTSSGQFSDQQRMAGLGLAGSLGATGAGISLDAGRALGDASRGDASLRLSAGSGLSGVNEANLGRRVAGAEANTSAAQFSANQKQQSLGLAGQLGLSGANYGLDATKALGTSADSDFGRRERAATGSTDAALSGLGLAGTLTGQGSNIKATAASGLNSSFDTERGRQIQSMLFAPQAAEQDYTDLRQLLGVGGEFEAQGGRTLQDLISRFNFNQQDPYDRSSALLTALLGAGGAGGTSTSTQPLYRQGGGLGGALGGAATASSLATSLGAAAGGPIGIGAALLGALAGG